ncbi:MAG: phosphoribosylformylglycinamidine synthase [Christensenellales bacterium]
MVKRIFVEKKEGYNVSAKKTLADVKNVLGIAAEDVREFIRYDVENIDEQVFDSAKATIFSEAPVDNLFEQLPDLTGYAVFAVEYLPGQYDQRADSAMQCVQLLSMGQRPLIRCAKIYAVKGCNDAQLAAVKKYLINPVEAREGDMALPETLATQVELQLSVPVIKGFINMSDEQIAAYHTSKGFAMSVADLAFVRDYFASEKRDPSETELKVIDTYWSDHCRHTTFATEITDVDVQSDNPHVGKALELYNDLYKEFNSDRSNKYKCLMDIATIAVKKLKKEGKLDNLDVSDEINACSVEVDVDVDGKDEKWLIMFKNETHNHPTEIEPFGGAATCLGGAIRDPLSGRTYVYQAMRVTGAADPRKPVEETLKGKLPQRVITKTAAAGYSSYGNQIGLATGLVAEMYHPGYVAKRLETGYVIAGAPKQNVVRRKPIEGDVIVLLGGETGRDGCGGATGSSKAHTEKSVEVCGAEVQKGNPPTERKIQRLFRNKDVARLIVKCNDFGAGGVSVAIGELADSLDIYLDKVPKKYEGLSGTELAISESQERMAVVLAKDTVEQFINYAKEENLNAVAVAEVTDNGRMRMFYAGNCIVDLKRSFLDTNGVKQSTKAVIKDNLTDYMSKPDETSAKLFDKGDFEAMLYHELSRLNVCSTKGLGEMFDSTIGAASVLMPFGGKYQLTPAVAMASKPPVNGKTDTATVSSYGCSPQLMSSSPFVGSVYSIVMSLSKLVACGVKTDTIRLSLQEFFMRLGNDPQRWGQPLSALLGALYAQIGLGVGAIGGKDSMSGSFENIDVPPTLISFAMGIAKASKIISNTFCYDGNVKDIYHVALPQDEYGMIDFAKTLRLYDAIYAAIIAGKIKACNVVEEGGVLVSVFKACMGNKLGTNWESLDVEMITPRFGDFVILADDVDDLQEFEVKKVATLNGTYTCDLCGVQVKMDKAIQAFTSTLEGVFPTTAAATGESHNLICVARKHEKAPRNIVKPTVLIPVFPGTNCEYDTARAFERAGAKADVFIIKNQSAKDIEETAKALVKAIDKAQILAFPGGFSGGDEPDGSGKFIATTFKNPAIAEAVMKLLYNRDGLALGICNGFQALIKLGLVPYGDIREQKADAPTLTFNNISRHVSTIVNVRVATNKSPWLNACHVDDVYKVAVSHGEGRFVSGQEELDKLVRAGQVATQYVDVFGNATMTSPYNPNGSMNAIEGIISPDGRVLGKMGHSERIDDNLYKNVEGNYDMKLFESGVNYFR